MGNSCCVGLAWGVALSTKFTFGPIYLLWPACAAAYYAARGLNSLPRLPGVLLHHAFHGLLALLVVTTAYGGSELGVRLRDHGLRSNLFRPMTGRVDGEGVFAAVSEFIALMPSPLPKQYLVGVDEQQLDLEAGYPTYVMGQWYPRGIWWYYLAALIIKERVTLQAGLAAILIFAGWRGLRGGRGYAGDTADVVFCLAAAASSMLILSLNPRMALNFRYAFPALPALYCAAGIAAAKLARRAPIRYTPLHVVPLLMLAEMGLAFPDYFAYANPVAGGSRRRPPALHDSNFDGGQAVWALERHLRENPSSGECERYFCVHTSLPPEGIAFEPLPPPPSILKLAIAACRSEKRTPVDANESSVEIFCMRGLSAPAPWTKLRGSDDPEVLKLVQTLLHEPPDAYISSTLCVYRIRGFRSAGLAK